MQREQQRQPHDDGDTGDGKVAITVTDVQGKSSHLRVPKGTRVKEFLEKTLKHKWRAGLTYKVDNRLLSADSATGELEDSELGNPVLEEGAHLLISQTFQGGAGTN